MSAGLPLPRQPGPAAHRRRRRRGCGGYGVTQPGAYTSTPAWWGREHWRSALLSDLQTDEVRELRSAVGTRGPVSMRAIYAVAVAISAAADGATGRNALPGNTALTLKAGDLDDTDPDALARLAASSGYGLTTVQKAVQVLARRGWLVLVRPGKNRLTRGERLELHTAASKVRRRRNVWACTLPAHVRRPEPPARGRQHTPAHPPAVDNPPDGKPSTDPGCDLPTPRRGMWVPCVRPDKNFKPERASRTGAPRRTPTRNGRPGRTHRTDPRAVQVATDLRTRVPWLRHVPHQRIMPPLHRFAVAGWSAAQLQAHLDRLLAQRGWTVPGSPGETVRDRFGRAHHRPASTMRSPWGYLAFLLRHLDPSDLAGEQQHAAELAAREQYQRLLIVGSPCPHGQPAGDVPSPTRGVLACPLCRREPSTRDSAPRPQISRTLRPELPPSACAAATVTRGSVASAVRPRRPGSSSLGPAGLHARALREAPRHS